MQDFMAGTLTSLLLVFAKKVLFLLDETLTKGACLQQLREVWTNNFKSSPAEEDDAQEDDVEMTGGGIERFLFSMMLKKKTRDKTLEITLKASINTMLPIYVADTHTHTRRLRPHTILP